MLFGSNVANAQPVVMKYLYLARREGTRVRWSTRTASPASSATGCRPTPRARCSARKMTDEFFPVNIGGDIAFITGVMKVLAATGGLDEDVRRASTPPGFAELVGVLDDLPFDELERLSGRDPRATWSASPAMYAASDSAIFVWSMGLTQHAFGVGQRAGRDQPRARPRQRRARGRGPHAHPRPLGRAGRRRDGRLRHRAAGRRRARRRLGRGRRRALGLRPARRRRA